MTLRTISFINKRQPAEEIQHQATLKTFVLGQPFPGQQLDLGLHHFPAVVQDKTDTVCRRQNHIYKHKHRAGLHNASETDNYQYSKQTSGKVKRRL